MEAFPFYGPLSNGFDVCLHIYVCLCHITHIHISVVYVVKEVVLFRGLSQLIGAVHNRIHTQALQTSRKKATCSLRRNWN